MQIPRGAFIAVLDADFLAKRYVFFRLFCFHCVSCYLFDMIPCFSLIRAGDKHNPAFALPFRKQWILNLSTGMRTSQKSIDTFAKFRNRSTEKVNKRGFCNDSAPLPAGSAGTGLDTTDFDNVQSIIEELQARHGLDFDVRSARESLQRTQFLEEDLSILMNGPFAKLSKPNH